MESKLSFPTFHFFLFLLLICICTLKVKGQGNSNVNDVFNFGALADGISDNSKAFLSAWNAACQGKSQGKVVIQPGTYLMNPVIFEGPCSNPMVFELDGTLRAPPGLLNDEYGWIGFSNINGLTISGRGTFDGQGPSAWPYNECGDPLRCKPLPVSVQFNSVKNVRVVGITSLNSKFFHMTVHGSQGMIFSNINIRAPADSPNTDGIHIAKSNNINIFNSVIATGDDCVSLGPGSTDIRISGVHCGPGHGISIGSLGRYPNEADVSRISVTRCTLSHTQNGLRIKTWAPSPYSKVSDVVFEDIILNNVQNPIVIDQHYCPHRACNKNTNSQVEISNVKFLNIKGTSSTKVAVDLQCSRSVPCQGIVMSWINITSYINPKVPTDSFCSNAIGKAYGSLIPPPCFF